MKLIIDIDENVFTRLFDCGTEDMIDLDRIKACNAIRKGTPIPDNATNGEVIKTMFDIKEVDMENTYCVHFPEEEEYGHYFFKGWWNAPYQKGGNE